MAEKRVRARLAQGVHSTYGEFEIRNVQFPRGTYLTLPDEFDIVWDEPDNPPPHQCPKLKEQHLRISRGRYGHWNMEHLKVDGGWQYDSTVYHGCSCCDWVVLGGEPEDEWVPLCDVSPGTIFIGRSGKQYVRCAGDKLMVVEVSNGPHYIVKNVGLEVKLVRPSK